jgi:prepilin-type N-terminal cleavage/methylation domain-containing protein
LGHHFVKNSRLSIGKRVEPVAAIEMDSKRNQVFPRKCGRRGLTLPEVMITTVLVSVMLVTAMRTVGAVFHTRLVAQQRQEGEILAYDLLAEVMAAAYEDADETVGSFGLDSGETGDGSRALWDDVDDYDGWEALPPESRDGTPVPGADGWKREVTVSRAVRPTPRLNWLLDTGLKRIRVRATSPDGENFELTALRSRWGALEAKPPIDVTYVTGVSAQIQVGDQPEATQSGTVVVNHAQGP